MVGYHALRPLMSRLSLGLFRVLLLLGVLALWAMVAARQLARDLGTTTFGDAYRQLAERTPAFAAPLLDHAWWGLPALAAVPTLLLVWPGRGRPRARPAPLSSDIPAADDPAAAEPVRPPPIEAEAVELLEAEPDGYLKEQHVYPGSAKLSLAPEFRAIPARPFARGRILVEYAAYSSAFHQWLPRRRILIAEIHDQDDDEWSVISVELMTRYRDEAGRLAWRWARELDHGAPHDDDYAFARDEPYQARVVFAAPDGSEDYTYFTILPAKDAPGGAPNVVGQHVFDFVAEWAREDAGRRV